MRPLIWSFAVGGLVGLLTDALLVHYLPPLEMLAVWAGYQFQPYLSSQGGGVGSLVADDLRDIEVFAVLTGICTAGIMALAQSIGGVFHARRRSGSSALLLRELMRDHSRRRSGPSPAFIQPPERPRESPPSVGRPRDQRAEEAPVVTGGQSSEPVVGVPETPAHEPSVAGQASGESRAIQAEPSISKASSIRPAPPIPDAESAREQAPAVSQSKVVPDTHLPERRAVLTPQDQNVSVQGVSSSTVPPSPVVQPEAAGQGPPASPARSEVQRRLVSHWRLSKLPFENTPDPHFYFPTPTHEETLARLRYVIEGRKGLALMTGDVGAGKTLLSRILIHRLPSNRYEVGVLTMPVLSPTDLIREILYQLGVETNGSKGALLRQLNERLLTKVERGVDTVVIIDEAQVIQNDQTFDELRLLLNFQLNDRFLLTLLLFGQPELDASINRMPQIAQRVALRLHLGPLGAEEATSYLRHRMQIAGGDPALFTAEAVERIIEVSGGLPRLLNTLGDLCLLAGLILQTTRIDRALVDKAAAEMGRRYQT